MMQGKTLLEALIVRRDSLLDPEPVVGGSLAAFKTLERSGSGERGGLLGGEASARARGRSAAGVIDIWQVVARNVDPLRMPFLLVLGEARHAGINSRPNQPHSEGCASVKRSSDEHRWRIVAIEGDLTKKFLSKIVAYRCNNKIDIPETGSDHVRVGEVLELRIGFDTRADP